MIWKSLSSMLAQYFPSFSHPEYIENLLHTTGSEVSGPLTSSWSPEASVDTAAHACLLQQSPWLTQWEPLPATYTGTLGPSLGLHGLNFWSLWFFPYTFIPLSDTMCEPPGTLQQAREMLCPTPYKADYPFISSWKLLSPLKSERQMACL